MQTLYRYDDHLAIEDMADEFTLTTKFHPEVAVDEIVRKWADHGFEVIDLRSVSP